MPRILTPATHSEETLEIARDLLPPGFDLVMAPHGRPEFFDLLKDTEYYIGARAIPARCRNSTRRRQSCGSCRP